MTWTDLTFVDCSVLTAAKMTALQGNFAAVAAGEPGAPPLHIDAVSSLATVHAASGFTGPQVSSFATLHAASGMLGPGVSSFGGVRVGSDVLAPGSHTLGHLSVSSGVLVPPGPVAPAPNTVFAQSLLRAAVRFNSNVTPNSIYTAFNVASVGALGQGRYRVYFETPFASADYVVGGGVSTDNTFAGVWLGEVTLTTTTADINSRRTDTNALVDRSHLHLLFFGLQ